MKVIKTGSKRGFFQVLHSTSSAQAAMSTLGKGKSTSEEPANEHPRSEQWVYVVSGAGRAVVGTRRTSLRTGSLLLIEKGKKHQIKQTGTKPLVLLNFYSPPAYDEDGEVKGWGLKLW